MTTTASRRGSSPAPSARATGAPSAEARSLYALTIEAQQVDGQLAIAFEMATSDDPLQQEQAEALITSLLQDSHHHQGLLLQKANAIGRVHEALLGKARFLRQSAADRLARAEREERGAERLLHYLSRCLCALHPGQRSFSLPEYTLRSRQSSAIAIDDDARIPAELCRHEIRIRVAPEAHGALTPLLEAISAAAAANPASSCEVQTSSCPDKAAIRQACLNGQSVAGARLESRLHWSLQ
ncbi:MAG: hypothetical protein VKJ05_08215 [Synechococcaceae cyanobacterium]|nr:hypothetical protein [Synechococcaceae cyanobacterium]